MSGKKSTPATAVSFFFFGGGGGEASVLNDQGSKVLAVRSKKKGHATLLRKLKHFYSFVQRRLTKKKCQPFSF